MDERLRRALAGDGQPRRGTEWLDPLDESRRKPDVPSRLQGYRNRNKDQAKTWKTANGEVRQVDFTRYYTGTCRSCGCKVTAQRDVKRYSGRQQTKIGRWPVYCGTCGPDKRKQHDTDAAQRMRDLRARRKAAKQAADTENK